MVSVNCVVLTSEYTIISSYHSQELSYLWFYIKLEKLAISNFDELQLTEAPLTSRQSFLYYLLFVFHCTHVQMSYVLNSYLFTYCAGFSHCTCTAHTQKLYFRASGQNFDITIRFIDPYFLQECNNLALRQHFRVFFFMVQVENLPYFDFQSIWPWTCITCCALHVNDFHQVLSRSPYPFHRSILNILFQMPCLLFTPNHIT